MNEIEQHLCLVTLLVSPTSRVSVRVYKAIIH
jgi:hypothetical protein